MNLPTVLHPDNWYHIKWWPCLVHVQVLCTQLVGLITVAITSQSTGCNHQTILIIWKRLRNNVSCVLSLMYEHCCTNTMFVRTIRHVHNIAVHVSWFGCVELKQGDRRFTYAHWNNGLQTKQVWLSIKEWAFWPAHRHSSSTAKPTLMHCLNTASLMNERCTQRLPLVSVCTCLPYSLNLWAYV